MSIDKIRRQQIDSSPRAIPEGYTGGFGEDGRPLDPAAYTRFRLIAAIAAQQVVVAKPVETVGLDIQNIAS